MARYTLRLSVDGIGAKQRLQLPPANRVLYLRDGDAVARTGGQAYSLGPNTATQGPHATVVEGGQNGAWHHRKHVVYDPESLSDAFAVQHRQHSRHRRIDQRDVGVRVVAEGGRRAGEQLGI